VLLVSIVCIYLLYLTKELSEEKGITNHHGESLRHIPWHGFCD